MHRRSVSVLAASLLILAAGGCAGGGKDDSKADVKAHVAEQLVDEGMTGDQADCFADVIVDEVGVDDVKDVDFSAPEPPAGKQDEFVAAAQRALSDCDIDAGSLEG
jgi:hypothetical protein